MLKTNDLSRSVTPFKQGNTLIAVIEMSLPTWLVAGAMTPDFHPFGARVWG